MKILFAVKSIFFALPAAFFLAGCVSIFGPSTLEETSIYRKAQKNDAHYMAILGDLYYCGSETIAVHKKGKDEATLCLQYSVDWIPEKGEADKLKNVIIRKDINKALEWWSSSIEYGFRYYGYSSLYYDTSILGCLAALNLDENAESSEQLFNAYVKAVGDLAARLQKYPKQNAYGKYLGMHEDLLRIQDPARKRSEILKVYANSQKTKTFNDIRTGFYSKIPVICEKEEKQFFADNFPGGFAKLSMDPFFRPEKGTAYLLTSSSDFSILETLPDETKLVAGDNKGGSIPLFPITGRNYLFKNLPEKTYNPGGKINYNKGPVERTIREGVYEYVGTVKHSYKGKEYVAHAFNEVDFKLKVFDEYKESAFSQKSRWGVKVSE